ncbi:hypothetical protein PENTCL1PPCAC_9506, partial [Pristionchus entomophagus]
EFYNIDLFASNKPGYLALTFWTLNSKGEKQLIPRSLYTIVCASAVALATGAVIVLCTVRIIRELRANESMVSTLSPVTKRLQKQLFTTLLVQTIFPCFTSYLPVVTVFAVPLTGISLGGVGTVCVMFT